MPSPKFSPTALRASAVVGAGAAEGLLNDVLGPLGFAPVQMVNSLEEMTLQLRASAPRLVIVPVPPGGHSPAFEAFASELRRNQGTACIGTAAAKDADTVLAALRAGVTEFLLAPVERAELDTAMQRLRSITATSVGGQLVTVYSAKGGVGVSTIATSLAWSLAHRPGRPKVALVDFSTAGAGIRIQLDLEPTYDISSIAAKAAELDREVLKSCMVEHEQGVSVLVASEDLDAADSLDSGTAAAVLELLAKDFDFVVVDTDHHLTDQTLAALDAANRIVLVSEPQVITLRSTQRTLSVFSRLGYSADKITVVMNRCSEQDRVSDADAERVLTRRIAARLPRDFATVADAITFGKFVPQQNPKSPLTLSLAQLAEVVASGEIGAAHRTKKHNSSSRLSRIFGRA